MGTHGKEGFMSRRITSLTTLDNLKKEAKRRRRANPAVPLRAHQHELAREYGFASWALLRSALASPLPPTDRFLEFACPDHHVRSRPAHRTAEAAAIRLLARHPDLARADIDTAVVCGELDHVTRLLQDRPDLANARRAPQDAVRSGSGGAYDFLQTLAPKDWTPLLFLCFTRLPLPRANDNAVAIARLLLDRGADPNAFFLAGGSRYTPLVGAIGEGEEDRPPHPRRDELARLLLERGADPYDNQVTYNLRFHGNVLWWLQLVYEFSVNAGRAADWRHPAWPMLDMGGYGSGARWYLSGAIEHNDLALAEWCLAHGADPNAAPGSAQSFPQASLYQLALRAGRTGIADLLLRYGAPREDITLEPEDAFVSAVLRLDRPAVEAALAQHPEFRDSPRAMFAAAREDRPDAIALLLDLGASVNVRDERDQCALHIAAWHNSLRAAEFLIAHGVEVDIYETNYSDTPLGFATHADRRDMIDLIAPHSGDVWSLVQLGNLDRLRDVIGATPRLATIAWQTTPLFWLPDDESIAAEIVKLFLANGADPAFRSRKDGTTAADAARARGMNEVAALLDVPTSNRAEFLLATHEQLAQDLLTVSTVDDEEALGRLARHFDRILTFQQVRTYLVERPIATIDDARNLIAQQSGHASWSAFLASLGAAPPLAETSGPWQKLAEDFVQAYEGDAEAIARLNAHYQRSFTHDDVRAEIWRRVYAFRQRSSKVSKNFLKLEEAQLILAQDAGVSSWGALIGKAPSVPPFAIDERANRISPRRRLSDSEWDDLVVVMKERRIPALDAQGLMNDRAIERVATLDSITTLNLGGSRELTDDGLLQLARMPQLERLNLSEYPGGKLTDRGLAVLRHLPNLRHFEMTWQAGISDAGVANLRFCDRLESVDLMGSPTGDGAIEALSGKLHLRKLQTGRLVTNAGLRFLPEVEELLLDGPITDEGLAHVARRVSLRNLDLFWHVDRVTAGGFEHLTRLPNLEVLGCDGSLSNDAAMVHIGAMPSLKRLRAQESAATDEGFVALARSRTLEGYWGRNSEGFGDRAFVAFSNVPTLRSLGVSLAKVTDLSLFPAFPELRELTPVGLTDDGFRYVGECRKLERLSCMYCRESGDAATAHIAGLQLKYYYAGLTQITDRSLEILGRMDSLEQIEFYECQHVTDAGLPHLAALPNLKEVHLDSLPGVTLEGTKVFPPTVAVQYST
jgi:ankyrin repeat protein